MYVHIKRKNLVFMRVAGFYEQFTGGVRFPYELLTVKTAQP